MNKNRALKIFKKLHKWPAIIIAFFAILFATSGIVMNHRGIFSAIDVSRKLLPPNYTYNNWNLAAVRGSLQTPENEILVYGNVGIWKSDEDFQQFSDFNQGFPKGIDNRKIYSVVQLNNLFFAGTHMGLFSRNTSKDTWVKIHLPVRENRIADVSLKGDTLLVLTRHYLLKSTDGETFETIQLPAPVGYERKTGLFDTFWQLHSGELWGLPGKLIVDLLGLVTILLSVTGVLHFFFPKIIKKRKQKQKQVRSLVSVKKKNLRLSTPFQECIYGRRYLLPLPANRWKSFLAHISTARTRGSTGCEGFCGTKLQKNIFSPHLRVFILRMNSLQNLCNQPSRNHR
jgi:hypothetical protein